MTRSNPDAVYQKENRFQDNFMQMCAVSFGLSDFLCEKITLQAAGSPLAWGRQGHQLAAANVSI